MTATGRDRFWLTNRVVNPVLRPLLRRRAGRRPGRTLAVIRYRGRRTGQPREVVVQYARDGDEVWVVPGHAEAKRWWRNFESPRHVEVWLGGAHSAAVASVLRAADDSAEVDRGLAVYLAQLPRARKALGITEDGSAPTPTPPVVVRLDLHATPTVG